MKRLILRALGLVAAAALALLPLAAVPQTTNQPPTNQVIVLPLHISGQYTASQTGIVRVAMPFAAQLISAQASARASGGTAPTLTVDVLDSGASMLSAPIAVTAGAVAFGTVTDTSIADEAVLTINLAIGGTSPTWNDITIVLTFVR